DLLPRRVLVDVASVLLSEGEQLLAGHGIEVELVVALGAGIDGGTVVIRLLSPSPPSAIITAVQNNERGRVPVLEPLSRRFEQFPGLPDPLLPAVVEAPDRFHP